jgi:FkbM family methyltransferase
MSWPRLNNRAILSRVFSKLGLFQKNKIKIIDVGVSGGFIDIFDPISPDIIGYGFDPLVNEIERLKKYNQTPNIHYFDYFVTCYNLSELSNEYKKKNNQPFEKTSAAYAVKLIEHYKNKDYTNPFYAPEGEKKYTDKYITIDDFCQKNNIQDIDFIKIDTDGHDFMVLKGAEKTLTELKTLGVMVEAQFHGIPHPEANTFANIDNYLRNLGFSLFDLEIYRYSRASLPSEFLYKFIPAQTKTGQVLWGDAIYFRDLAIDDYEKIWNFEITTSKLIKLAAFYEMLSLEDCTAELFIKFADKLQGIIDIKQCLNIITPNASLDDPDAYEKYIENFKQFVIKNLG